MSYMWEDITEYVDSAVGSNITATGALDSGSITSGFGNIDNGSSTISTGDITTSGEVDQTVTGGTYTAHSTDYTFVNDSNNSSGSTITLFTLTAPYSNHMGMMIMDLVTTTTYGTAQAGRYTFAIGKAQGSTWYLKAVVSEGDTVYSDGNRAGETQSVVVSVVDNQEVWTGPQTSSIRVANTLSNGQWSAHATVKLIQFDTSGEGLMTLA